MTALAAPLPLQPALPPTDSFRRVSNVVAGVVLATAGALLGIAGVHPLATALTMAGVHMVVQEVGQRIADSPVTKWLNGASLRQRELRHFGELSAAVVMVTAGTLLSMAAIPEVGAPFIVVGVEVAIHAVAAIREDLAEGRVLRRLRRDAEATGCDMGMG